MELEASWRRAAAVHSCSSDAQAADDLEDAAQQSAQDMRG